MSIALNWMPEESLQWFVPVAPIGTGPSLLVVPNALPVNSVKELIALAKSKPGQLNAGSAGPGSFQHLATELFRLQSGIDIVIVQYKGGGPALTDTIGGQVQMNIGSAVQKALANAWSEVGLSVPPSLTRKPVNRANRRNRPLLRRAA